MADIEEKYLQGLKELFESNERLIQRNQALEDQIQKIREHILGILQICELVKMEKNMAIPEIFRKSIDELEFRVRTYNCLKNANIQTIGDLVRKNREELSATKYFGVKSLKEIDEELGRSGLKFGMTEEDMLIWNPPA